jgi:LacI family transcriptional regulator
MTGKRKQEPPSPADQPTRRTMVTQRDIAERCGIHQTTVSLALRHDPRISHETTDAIMAIAAEMGYDPSVHMPARRLAMHRHGHEVLNHVIAVSMDASSLHMHYYAAIFQGMVDVLMTEGFAVVLAHLPKTATSPDDVILPTIFNRGDVDGLLYTIDEHRFTPVFARLQRTPGFVSRPMISVMWPCDVNSYVMADDRQGAYLAAKHLLDLGHRHLLQLSQRQVKQDQRIQHWRWEGARQALGEYGLDPETHLHFFDVEQEWLNPQWNPLGNPPAVPLSREDVSRHPLLAYLTGHPEVTGVMALNDSSAIQVWYLLNLVGKRVPDDISIVGFDDVDPMFDDYGRNQLTSVRMPLMQIGKKAARLIISQVMGHATEPIRAHLPTELIVRTSTGPARVTIPE